uniref:Mitochondrial calcium uptake family, member 3b n=1 Tax=Cyprinus carpio TaxID=7962 RepID=A0A8C1G1V6_CYPCA
MMAAVRRFLALRNKFTSSTNGLSLYFTSRQSWRERAVMVGTELCITVGGFAVVYYQHYASLRALISPLPTVAAKEKASASAEDEEVSMSAHEHRFRLFSSLEYDGQLYMTPLDFIESVTMSEPKKKRFWRSLKKQDLDKILSDAPPVWKGSSRLFRNLRERGVISYTEYLFLLCILTKPHAGFKIAFKMFDADGNEMVDKREFMVLEEIFRKKNEKKKERGGDPDSYSQLSVELYGHQGSVSSNVLKKEQPQFEPRSFWDVLRHGARIVLFSDLMEVQVSSSLRSLIRISTHITLGHSLSPIPCEVLPSVSCLFFFFFLWYHHFHSLTSLHFMLLQLDMNRSLKTLKCI